MQEFQGENNNNNGALELWLDLRGTSLTPKTALELWDLEVDQNSHQKQQLEGDEIMDSLPKAPFVKCLVSSKGGTSLQNDNEIDQNIDVLLVAQSNDDNDMMSIFQQTNQSFGRLLSLKASSSMPILPDPLPAMEVASKGQWVILDTDGWKKIEEEERVSMVLPLMELICSGASKSGGGIGLTCHTKNEVVKAAMFIQSLVGNASGNVGGNARTKTLASGIVIPDENDGAASSSAKHHFAIIVPFDMQLIRTAKLLIADKES